MEISRKNILIKSTSDNINKFKRLGFEFYQKNNMIHLFSFRHFLILILLNMKEKFLQSNINLLSPNEDFIKFYKRKGTNINKENSESQIKEKINFYLEIKYYNFFYVIMHNYYLQYEKDSSNFSSFVFFNKIIDFISKEELKMIDFDNESIHEKLE